MAILRNRLVRRFGVLSLLSDLALVGAAASRLAQRRNGTAQRASATELALAGGALYRLAQRFRRRRKAKKLAGTDLVVEGG